MEPRSTYLRPLFQFRLRTLLLVVFLVSLWLSWRYRRHVEPPLPPAWKPGKFSRTQAFAGGVPAQSQNIKWCVPLGSNTQGSPVVSGGRVFIGTNNGNGYLKRYPENVDLGVLLCFDAADGTFLWQASSEKVMLLPDKGYLSRAEDWPLGGVASTPVVAGDRLWYVNNRAEVVCLDIAGFHDGKNDGPVIDEHPGDHEADVIWKFDMRANLGVYVHEQSPCSPATDGKRIFVVTSNGIAQDHIHIPSPTAPSFIALDRQTGQLLWTDNSPGANILHMQWGSPTFAVIGGVPQVIFPGGDGWLYSFDPAGTPEGKSKLLWKFDLNPKASVHELGGRGTRNETAFYVTVSGNLVYAIAGQDAEHGSGPSVFWCIDGTKRGDVSAELAVHKNAPTIPLPPAKPSAISAAAGEIAVPNPNSAVVWKFDEQDVDKNGRIDFGERIDRTRGAVVVKDGLALVADFSGLVHCFDAKNGQRLWHYDLGAACWTSPLIAAGHAYVLDEDGDVAIFKLPPRGSPPQPSVPLAPIAEINMLNSIYSVPVARDGVLYIATGQRLFAIETPAPK